MASENENSNQSIRPKSEILGTGLGDPDCTLELLIKFGFRKPALRLGIIRAGRDFPYSADCPAWQRPRWQWPHAEPGTGTPLTEWYLPPARLEQWAGPRRGRTAGPGGAEAPLAVATDGGGATATESRAARAAQRGFQPGQAGGPSVCGAIVLSRR